MASHAEWEDLWDWGSNVQIHPWVRILSQLAVIEIQRMAVYLTILTFKFARWKTARIQQLEAEVDTREERNQINMIHMGQFQAQCDKAYQKAQRAVSEREAALQQVEEVKRKCSDLQAAVKVLHQAGKVNTARATDHSKCLCEIEDLKAQLAIKRGVMCAYTTETGDSDPGVEWGDLEEDACHYATASVTADWGPPPPFPVVEPTAPPNPAPIWENSVSAPSPFTIPISPVTNPVPVPMNPVTTQRQDGQNHNVTYVTPYSMTQLTDIAKAIEVFEPSGDPQALFDQVTQYRGLNGQDEAEEVKLILLCLSPAIRSALPKPQNVAGGTLPEMKAAVLAAIGYNRDDSVQGLNNCQQKRGEHPTAYAGQLWNQFLRFSAN